MALGDMERRQRWAAFSVKAHRDLGSLAADIPLYDRIILPVPENDAEYDRWVRAHWDPDKLAPVVVQAAGHIIAVPWTTQLQQEWKTRWDAMKALGEEVSNGMMCDRSTRHRSSQTVARLFVINVNHPSIIMSADHRVHTAGTGRLLRTPSWEKIGDKAIGTVTGRPSERLCHEGAEPLVHERDRVVRQIPRPAHGETRLAFDQP